MRNLPQKAEKSTIPFESFESLSIKAWFRRFGRQQHLRSLCLCFYVVESPQIDYFYRRVCNKVMFCTTRSNCCTMVQPWGHQLNRCFIHLTIVLLKSKLIKTEDRKTWIEQNPLPDCVCSLKPLIIETVLVLSEPVHPVCFSLNRKQFLYCEFSVAEFSKKKEIAVGCELCHP